MRLLSRIPWIVFLWFIALVIICTATTAKCIAQDSGNSSIVKELSENGKASPNIIEQFNKVAGGIEAIATTLALLLGGVWAYLRFIRQQERYPHIAFSADINFVKQQGDWWVVELISWIENKGKVQHRVENFRFDLAAIKPEDPIEVSEEKWGGQINFPHIIAEGSWVPEDWDYTFVDPGVKTHYSYITRIPRSASIVLLHSRFEYLDGRQAWHDAEKIAAVPQSDTALDA